MRRLLVGGPPAAEVRPCLAADIVCRRDLLDSCVSAWRSASALSSGAGVSCWTGLICYLKLSQQDEFRRAVLAARWRSDIPL